MCLWCTSGGPSCPVAFCRSDATDNSQCPENGRLPDATQGAQHLRDVFYRMGFNDQEIVALSVRASSWGVLYSEYFCQHVRRLSSIRERISQSELCNVSWTSICFENLYVEHIDYILKEWFKHTHLVHPNHAHGGNGLVVISVAVFLTCHSEQIESIEILTRWTSNQNGRRVTL